MVLKERDFLNNLYEKDINFTAIDFETAHGKNWSICQIGAVQVVKGTIVKEIEILVQPPGNNYHWGNSKVHGITPEHTKKSPLFKEVWSDIKPLIDGQLIVAHNAKFDCSCLRETLKYYQLRVPEFESCCTVEIYKKNLAKLCAIHNIELNHHNALSDARACAILFLKYMQEVNCV